MNPKPDFAARADSVVNRKFSAPQVSVAPYIADELLIRSFVLILTGDNGSEPKKRCWCREVMVVIDCEITLILQI
jgi:hypothetical protein